MSSKKGAMKKKLENMNLGERINYGYKMVITMMLISGLLSIAVIGVLFFNMLNYVNKVNASDQAVKVCRINVTSAARNVREMALNPDKSTYDDYEQGAKEKLEDVDVQLKTIKKSGVVPENQYNEYSKALSDWANTGYSIMDKIKAGQKDGAVDQIINECTPKLNKTVELAKEIDKLTDERSLQAVVSTYVCAAVGLIVIIICLTCAWRLTKRTGKIVLDTILEPLHAIEDVAKELTEGNLHSTLEYHSEDEIGRLAHSMRKSIRILGSYVDDIDRSMKLFADGHFDAQPEVEWKGDFVGILNSFMEFEKSMAVTIKGIQHVSSEVSSAAASGQGPDTQAGPDFAKICGATGYTSSNIFSASSRISHWARLQQRRWKKFCRLRAFMVTTILVSQALGSTKRASSLACLLALARACFSGIPSAIRRAVWPSSSLWARSR